MNKPVSFLIVDDEKPVVMTLKALIKKTYPDSEIHEASDGREAWELIKKCNPRIVISDLNMPVMNGIELCQKIRNIDDFRFIFFIILTAATEKEQRIKAIKAGADDFLNKPFAADEFQARLGSGVRIAKMQMKMQDEKDLLIELADALEQEVQDMIKLAVKFLQARIPASMDMLKRVAEASVWIAKQLGSDDHDKIREIEIASFLCHAGKIFLPDELLTQPVMIDGKATDKLMYQIPVSAKEIISSVRRFQDVANILYNIYENFDGSGFPKKIRTWQIPLASRIIRVVLDYEEMRQHQKLSSSEALTKIQNQANRLYDQRVSVLMEQYTVLTGDTGEELTEQAVQLAELEAGMVITRDIMTNSGLKLMGSGTILTPKSIGWILSHNTSDPILGNVFVKI